jgi:putative CocE/NonD family hydrolase
LLLLAFFATTPVLAEETTEASPAVYGIEIRQERVTMPDGKNLAVEIFMPTGGRPDERFPVLLEYHPYRVTTYRGSRFPTYSYFVQRGFVVVAADERGSGNSEGTLGPGAYSEQALQDGEVLIDWLSEQAWSNGNVAMFGISYSGFIAIQMAMRQPPALKTILAIDSTEYLYAEDSYFIDGILHLDSYEMMMDVDNSRPGAPDYVIDEAYFRERFDQPPYTIANKQHQRDGAYWDRVSLKNRYELLRIPSFHIGGWYDGYRNSLPRMLEHLDAPVKAIIGPWIHTTPDDPYPEPGIEWRADAIRWFDHWLKGEDTGMLDEPDFAVFVRNWHPPGPYQAEVPGKWRWEESWPIERVTKDTFYFGANHQLEPKPGEPVTHLLRNVPTAGMEAGGPNSWWGEVAHDQRPTDAFSLVYDSEVLAADLEILGRPQAHLRVAADAPRANWYVRLSDVAPDGTVTLVTGAGFNGTHRESARDPAAIIPGEIFEIEPELHFTSWVFPAGHRIRVSISNAQWPMFWPTAYPLTSSLFLGGEQGSRIALPVVPFEQRPAPTFSPPAVNPEAPGYSHFDIAGTSSGYGEISEVSRNPQTAETVIRANTEYGQNLPWGTEFYKELIEYQTSDAHPENTTQTGKHSFRVVLEGRELLWEGDTLLRSDRENFYYEYVRRLTENGVLLREKTWKETIPRDFQ